MSERWQTTKAAGVPCGVCGKSDTCKFAPDGMAFLCRRDGNKVHQMNAKASGTAGGNGTGYVGQAHRKRHAAGNGAGGKRGPASAGGKAKAFATADDAIAAAGASLAGAVLAAVYAYHHADGSDAFRVARFDLADGDKSFRPVCPGKAGWKIGDPAGPLPLCLLPELLADPAATVYVTEGEKAADAARSLGLAATTSAHGSASAAGTDWTPLAGRDVVLLPDHDEPGAKYARTVAKILVKLDPPARVRVVELPGLPPGGDVVDYIAAAPDAMDLPDIGAQVAGLAEATAAADAADLVGGPVLVKAGDVAPVAVSWLWHRRLPLGRPSLLVGVPGAGKSYVTCDMAARVTTGTPWPDGSPCERGSVLFITAEDDMGDTIRPRLDACRADVDRVYQLTAVRRIDDETGKPRDVLFTLADVAAMEAALKRLPDCRLVVIDPIGSFLGGDVDAHRDNEVRAVLAPIGLLASRYGVAVLIVAHRRKGNAGSADETALGSRAFSGIVRSIWHLSPDPRDDNRRLLLPGKSSLARKGDGLAFTLIGEPTAAVVWERDPVRMTADDAMRDERAAEANGPSDRPGPEPAARNAAADWLAAELADLAEHKVADVRAAAGNAGLAWRTVQRARESLGVLVERATFGGEFIWRLPKPGAATPPPSAAAGPFSDPPAADAKPGPADGQFPWQRQAHRPAGDVRVVDGGGTGTELRDALADLVDRAERP